MPPPPPPAPAEEAAPKTTQKKQRRRLPTTPERDAAAKPIRRSKRLSNENENTNQTSPHKAAHARSHARQERSPSPFNARPVTVEKKRRKGADGVEEEKIMRIQLPFADTPVIKRNKEMRKTSAETGNRRSSSGMRGKRASSLIDEGRGNGELRMVLQRPFSDFDRIPLHSTAASLPATASMRLRSSSTSIPHHPGLGTPPPSDSQCPRSHIPRFTNALQNIFADETINDTALPHSEVPSAEFYKHISAELTEPRRMRCLLGWCGTRALPPKPEAPKDSTPASNLEFQALQAGTFKFTDGGRGELANLCIARVIQEELASDLVTKGTLSDWFSRDDNAPPVIPLRKRPNPRNAANAAKAEELERELER
jgi:kinetochore protein Mis13/DSN1